MPDEPILTVPAELDSVPQVVPTGNAWVTLPDIDTATGDVPSLTVLHDAAGGLIELRGAPLCASAVVVDGQPVPDDAWELELVAGLLPRWHASVHGCTVTTTVACPPDHHGSVHQVSVANHGDRPVDVEVAFSGRLDEASLHVFSARTIEGPHRWRFDPWSRALVWEISTGLPVVALAVRADDGAAPQLDLPRRTNDEEATEIGAHPADTRGGSDNAGGSGLEVAWSQRRAARLDPGGSTALTLYLGVAREADGATLATVDLARHGAEPLITRTRDWFDARRGPTLAGRADLQAVRDRNRLFCLTFAAGSTIDTEELVLVTSRSPRYYVSGAHWSRDSLLWAFPAVLAVDLALAAAWLRSAFTRYARNPGEHALYLDGGVLYPGFELDEVCAFLLALDRYLAIAHDDDLLGEPAVRDGLARVDAALDAARDDTTGLYRTFLLSTDDPAPRPFVTYSNALTVAALRARARILHRLGDEATGRVAEREADALRRTLLDHAVVDGSFGPMLCGATDGRGDTVLFDEPPGSLELLAHYGVLPAEDAVLRATMAWIRSAENPHGPGDGPYATPTCAHARHPWLLSVGNALLAGEDRWLDDLPRLPLDNGFACESFDAQTGEPRTGVGFATCAGWLAHAIDVATVREAARDENDHEDPDATS
jgi:uncharacterized protein